MEYAVRLQLDSQESSQAHDGSDVACSECQFADEDHLSEKAVKVPEALESFISISPLTPVIHYLSRKL